MQIEFDPAKDARNIRERGLSFQRVVDFDFETALYWADRRKEYGETRRIAMGYLDGRLHVLCYVRRAQTLRVISFRKANAREIARYAEAQAPD